MKRIVGLAIMTVIGVLCIAIGATLICKSIEDNATKAIIEEYKANGEYIPEDAKVYTIKGEDGHTYKITSWCVSSTTKVIE